MSQSRCRSILLSFMAAVIVFACGAPAAGVQEAATGNKVSSMEIESIIKSLEDPEARGKLIRQLEVLAQTGQEPVPQAAVKSAMAEMLQGISERVAVFSAAVMELTAGANRIPEVVTWGRKQMVDPAARNFWKEVLTRILLVIGFAYFAFYTVRGLLGRLRKAWTEPEAVGWTARFFRLVGLFLLDLLPIAAFAIVAYVTLGLVNPRETTRLVVLAWINAFMIVRLVIAISGALLAPEAPKLRLQKIEDETAYYLNIWVSRLARTAIYGYFGLQAMVFLGLPAASYELLLHLLGLAVTVLLVVLILQNRQEVSEYLLRFGAGETPPRETPAFKNRASRYWWLVAIFYVAFLYGVWASHIQGGFLFLVRATVVSALILVIGRAAFGLLNAAFRRGFRIGDELQERFPGLEERANRYLSTVKGVLRVLLGVVMVLALLQAWGMNAVGWFLSEPGRVLGTTVFRVAAIIVVAFVLWEVANGLLAGFLSETDEAGNLLTPSARARTLTSVARKALLLVLSVIATLMILTELGMNIGPLLAGAGVLGLAIGFGSQKLVQDLVTGVFILFEDQIAVDDVVKVADKAGLVEAVSIRSVRLRDFSGTVHTIPYSAISTVSNLTKEFSCAVFEVGVAYREDVDEVMEVLKQIGAELQEDPEFGPLILEPLEVAGVDAFADSAVIIKARIKTMPLKQWAVGRQFNRRMKKRFDELGIEIPFPHQTIYFGELKGGGPPPAHVQLVPAPGAGKGGSPG